MISIEMRFDYRYWNAKGSYINIPTHLLVVNPQVRTGTTLSRCKLIKRSQKTKRTPNDPENTRRQITTGDDQFHRISASWIAVTNMIDRPRNRIAPIRSRCLTEAHGLLLVFEASLWCGKFLGNAIILMMKGKVAAGMLEVNY